MITTANKTEESFFADILAAIDYGQVEASTVHEWEAESFIEVINPMIEAGATFDVWADNFKVLNAGALTTAQRDFVSIHAEALLYVLQQSLLTKHLFSHSKSKLSDFAMEIAERESMMTEAGKISFGSHFQAVRETTRRWFINLLNSN